jgi:hypothetical protein
MLNGKGSLMKPFFVSILEPTSYNNGNVSSFSFILYHEINQNQNTLLHGANRHQLAKQRQIDRVMYEGERWPP